MKIYINIKKTNRQHFIRISLNLTVPIPTFIPHPLTNLLDINNMYSEMNDYHLLHPQHLQHLLYLQHLRLPQLDLFLRVTTIIRNLMVPLGVLQVPVHFKVDYYVQARNI